MPRCAMHFLVIEAPLAVLPRVVSFDRRRPELPLHLHSDAIDRAVADRSFLLQRLHHRFKERTAVTRHERPSSAMDCVELRVGERERRHGRGTSIGLQETGTRA
jgi:hypothetical protein